MPYSPDDVSVMVGDPDFEKLTPGRRLEELDYAFNEAAAQVNEADMEQWKQFHQQERAHVLAQGQGRINTGLRTAVADVGQMLVGAAAAVPRLKRDVMGSLQTIPVIGDAVAKGFEVASIPALGMTLPDAAIEQIDSAAPAVEAYMAPDRQLNPWSATVGGGVGQGVGMLGATVATGGVAPVLALAGASGYNQGSQTAEELGITDPRGRLAVGAGMGGAELGIERLGGFGAAPAKSLVKSLVSEFVEEPVTGAVQDEIAMIAGQQVLDPKRPGFTTTGVDTTQYRPDDPRYWNRRAHEAVGGLAGGTVAVGGPEPEIAPVDMPEVLEPGNEGASDADFTAVDAEFAAAEVPSPAALPPSGSVTDGSITKAPGSYPGADVVNDAGSTPAAAAPSTSPTITGSNAQTGAEMPVPELAPGEVAPFVPYQGVQLENDTTGAAFDPSKQVSAKPPRIADHPAGRGVSDVLDFLNENPLQRAQGRKQGEFDGLRSEDVSAYWGKFIFGRKGRGYPPDELAQMAYEQGVLKEPTTSALAEAIQTSIKGRQTYRAQIVRGKLSERAEMQQSQRFERAKQSGDQPVPAADLAVGDKLIINDQPLEVTQVNFDEDGYTTDVQVKDGPVYGIQRLSGDEVLLVDEFKPTKRQAPSGEFLPDEAAPIELFDTGATLSTRPRNRGETAKPQAADPLAELGTATRTGANERAQRKLQLPESNDPDEALPSINPQLIRSQLGNRQGFLDTSGMAQVIGEAVHAVKKGAQTFAEWTSSMIRRYGQRVRKYLADAWKAATTKQIRFGNQSYTVRRNEAGAIDLRPSTREEKLDRVREIATMPNAPDTASGAKPLRAAGKAEGERVEDHTAFAVKAMKERAANIVDTMGSPAEVLSLLSNPNHGLAPELVSFVGTEAMLRAERAMDAATNEVDRILQQRTFNTLAQFKEQDNSQRGQSLVGVRYGDMDVRAVTGVSEALTKQQTETIDPVAPPDEVNPAIATAGTDAGEVATRRLPTSPNLRKLLDQMRLDVTGLSWPDLFKSLPARQKAWEMEVYRRLRGLDRFKGLSPEKLRDLTRELSKLWQAERAKVFNAELEKQLIKIGKVKPKTRAKLIKAAPRLLQLINLGALDAQTFREAVAQEWGIAKLSDPQAKALRVLAEKVQAAERGSKMWRADSIALINGLQRLTRLSKAELLNSWWMASMLSSPRTHVDVWLSIANTAETVALGSLLTARPKGMGGSGNLSVPVAAYGASLRRAPSAFVEAMYGLLSGDKSLYQHLDDGLDLSLEEGRRFRADVGQILWDRGGLRKIPGGLMLSVRRLMDAAAHFSIQTTRAGVQAMAMAYHPELYRSALTVTEIDRAEARAQARAELTDGAAPSTVAERLAENQRIREILEKRVPAEIMAEADQISANATLQGEPTGAGKLLLDMVRGIETYLRATVKSRQSDERLTGPLSRGWTAGMAGAQEFARLGLGMPFAGSAANALTWTLSHVPVLGLVNLADPKNVKGAPRDVILAQQMLGAAVVGGLAMALSAAGDDDEWFLEHNWSGYDAKMRNNKRAAGLAPNTIGYRDKRTGKITAYNYTQWGVAGVMSMMAHATERLGKGEGLLSAYLVSGVEGTMSFLDRASLQGLANMVGRSQSGEPSAKDIVEDINKWAATNVTAGIPNILKDADYWTSPQLTTNEGLAAAWTTRIPMLRTMMNGKRLDLLGEEIKLDRSPLARVAQTAQLSPERVMLGQFLEHGLTLQDPSNGLRKMRLHNGKHRDMTEAERDRYQRFTGEAYRELLRERGAEFLEMSKREGKEAAQKALDRSAEIKRDRAVLRARG
jgi:hypothetical protein